MDIFSKVSVVLNWYGIGAHNYPQVTSCNPNINHYCNLELESVKYQIQCVLSQSIADLSVETCLKRGNKLVSAAKY